MLKRLNAGQQIMATVYKGDMVLLNDQVMSGAKTIGTQGDAPRLRIALSHFWIITGYKPV